MPNYTDILYAAETHFVEVRNNVSDIKYYQVM
jgi:hypothetical protein